jgi:LacI family transcriptional regulator
MVTSRDVARVAGVSQATVSRAMLPQSRVKQETLQRILAAMGELGYVPNAAAQTMKTGRTNAVGVVVADITNPFYPEILDALTHSFDDAGKRVMIWNSDGLHNKIAIEALGQGIIDGLVFTTIAEDSAELRNAVSAGYPIVMVNRYVAGLGCDQVRSQNVQGAALVADHFLDNGRTRIACISGPQEVSTAREREAGFIDQLADRGHEIAPQYLKRGTFTHASGLNSVRELLNLAEPPDTIFCGNDLVAFGVLDYIRRRNMRVPQDIWIVGYDDIEMAAWDSFRLTTVRQHSTDMAREAARLLLKRIEDPTRPLEDICFPSALVLRETAGAV